MVNTDWLVGGARGAVAADRIHAAALDMVAKDGFDALDIDALAARVHCSRATIYRHVGGKTQIRDAIVVRAAARIVGIVRDAVDGLTGADRIMTAITVALAEIRSDPLEGPMLISMRKVGELTWLTESAVVAELARELNGLTDDPLAAQWIVRIVMSMLLWPADDPGAEQDMLRRFVEPAFRASDQLGVDS